MRIGEPVRDYVVEPLQEQPVSNVEPEDEEPQPEPRSVEAERETVPTA